MTRNTQCPSAPKAAARATNRFALTANPTRAAALLAAVLLVPALAARAAAPAIAKFVRPHTAFVANHVVWPSAADDADKISATLERAIVKQDFTSLPIAVVRPHSGMATIKGLAKASSTIVDAFVFLDHAPTTSDTDAIKAQGFTVKDVFSHVIYGVHIVGQLPSGVQTLRDLAKTVPGVTVIRPNRQFHLDAIQSQRQIGARQSWTNFEPHNATLPLQGDPERSIAIMDTGIDGSHPDLTGGTGGHKLVAFDDEESGGTTPEDYIGHGTFVAGVAAGTGQSGGIATGTGYLPVTLVGNYYLYDDSTSTTTTTTTVSSGLDLNGNIPIDTSGFTSNATLTVNGYAPDFFGGDTVTFGAATAAQLSTGAEDGSLLASVSGSTGSNNPITATASVTPGNVGDLYGYFNVSDLNDTNTVALAVQAPNTAVGDGFNLMSGTAPASQLVSIRIGDNTEEVDEDAIMRGFEFLSQNAQRYNIGVLNMSFGGDYDATDTDDPDDVAVNALVAQGIVCVAAAGNSRLDEAGIGSPADATDVIAVAAVGNANQITDYSSYGETGQDKPDVAAPGGSYPALDTNAGVPDVPSHDEDITSVDDNYDESGDYDNIDDVQANDYTDGEGTSFSSPHVAGSAALLEQALSLPGAFGGQSLSGEDEALSIKALLEMTATSTIANTADAPPAVAATTSFLTRDPSEGFGKINTDAAIGAVLNSFLPGGPTITGNLGTTATDTQSLAIATQAYAANVSLTAGTKYTFNLALGTTNAADTDYQLFLYSSGYNLDGSTSDGAGGDPVEPTPLAGTTLSGEGTPTITYTPKATEVDVVVVKRVSGSGPFTLSSTGYSASYLYVLVDDSNTYMPINGAEVIATDTTSGLQYNQAPTVTTTTTVGTGTTATTSTITQAVLAVPKAAAVTVSATAFGYYGGSTTVAADSNSAIPFVLLTPSHSFTTLGLQMISVPMQYAGQTIPQITLPELDTAAVYSPTLQAYEVTPEAPANTFTPGQGYWVRLKQPMSLNIQGTTVAAGTYSIPLQAGWNMIGSPYASPDSLESATVTLASGTSESFANANASNIVGPLYSYDSVNNVYDTLDVNAALTAYIGYWVHANQACTLNIAGS